MDHSRLLNRLRSRSTLELAFSYAVYDRLYGDYFFNPFEIEYALLNKQEVLDQLSGELASPSDYTASAAFAYYPPKNEHCYRRMVYIPFKDLVLRYAYAVVLADILDSEMSATCFANRRAQGSRAATALLEDFATKSWPDFCNWQRQKALKFECLLRTDISSFYDSISHVTLASSIAGALSVDERTDFMALFKRLLSFEVLSYFSVTPSPSDFKSMPLQQGLPIGNNTEGFLANIYLMDVDAVMNKIPGIAFARYNDDMRIFAHSTREANAAVLVLQKHLLSRGLNLNSSKTKFAAGRTGIDDLRSKDYEAVEYGQTEEDEVVPMPRVEDSPFDEFDPDEISRKIHGKGIVEAEDAKQFCRWLNMQENGRFVKSRTSTDVDFLGGILKRWHGCAKFAAWLLVQSAFWKGVRPAAQTKARAAMLEALRSPEVSSYAKYRILHHLVKRRTSSGDRYLGRMAGDVKQLVKTVDILLGEHAFELNLISLYVLRALGYKVAELRGIAARRLPQPVGEPIRAALFELADDIKPSPTLAPMTGPEPDSRPEHY